MFKPPPGWGEYKGEKLLLNESELRWLRSVLGTREERLVTDQSKRRPVTLVDILREYVGALNHATLGEATRRFVDGLTPKEREILRKRLGERLKESKP